MPAVCLVKAVTTAGQAGQPDKKQLQVTEEGKAVLQSDAFKRTPLVVVTIAGPARTGKSTMLNCILKRFGVNLEHDAGFQVGHSVSDTTEGMWLWSEPVVHNNTNHRLVSAAGDKVDCCLQATFHWGVSRPSIGVLWMRHYIWGDTTNVMKCMIMLSSGLFALLVQFSTVLISWQECVGSGGDCML